MRRDQDRQDSYPNGRYPDWQTRSLYQDGAQHNETCVGPENANGHIAKKHRDLGVAY
jgi:hypothetical protein